jgi:hypothetical protein
MLMAAKKFYRFAYYSTPERNDRDVLIHQLRDGDAALELAQVLHEFGYVYGGLLLNYPGNPDKHRQVDCDFLGRNDLLVMNTRPPLDDSDRRRVSRSYTDLEEKIFTALRGSVFTECSRSQITLHPSLSLRKEHAKYRSMEFRQYHGAYCVAYSGIPVARTESRTSVAFIIFKQQLWPGGPALLCVFGMGGPESLITNHLVRTRPELRGLVCKYEFVLIELHEQPVMLPQDDLRFLSQPGWSAKPVLKLIRVR